MSSSSTIVIGGGVVGVCTAYFLAKRGHKVTLIERSDAQLGASRGNAGIIALGHPPLPRPGLVWKTIKWMLNKGSPLYVPPRLDLQLIAWMWNFRKACNKQCFDKTMRILAEHGWATGKLWDQIVDEEAIDCDYHRTGWLDVFATEDGRKHALEDAAILRSHGFNIEELSGDELRRRDQAFKSNIIGAAHYTDSRFASPGKFVAQLTNRVKEMGVDVRTNCEVKRIVHNGSFERIVTGQGNEFAADTLVLAAGVWTSNLAKTMGVSIPMQAGKGYHINLEKPEPCPGIACVCNETYVAVTPMNGGLRLAGTVELSGVNHNLVQRRVDMLTEGARKYLHGIDSAKAESTWCGLRPCTADGLPVIGWAPRVKNVFIAAGHAKYGFAYGPVTGKIASECILDGKSSLDISPMRADRF